MTHHFGCSQCFCVAMGIGQVAFMPNPSGTGKKEQAEAAMLRHSAMLATRAGIGRSVLRVQSLSSLFKSCQYEYMSILLIQTFDGVWCQPALILRVLSDAEPKKEDKISRRILRQVMSSDPITARHALALAVDVARRVGACNLAHVRSCQNQSGQNEGLQAALTPPMPQEIVQADVVRVSVYYVPTECILYRQRGGFAVATCEPSLHVVTSCVYCTGAAGCAGCAGGLRPHD